MVGEVFDGVTLPGVVLAAEGGADGASPRSAFVNTNFALFVVFRRASSFLATSASDAVLDAWP